MASYMFLFIFAMVVFFTDARPSYKPWSTGNDYDNRLDYDAEDTINRFFNEKANRERQLRTLNQLPDFYYWTYQQRYFRRHHVDTNERKKRSIRSYDYDSPEYAIAFDGDHIVLM